MDSQTLRERYVTHTLAQSIHGDPSPFYEAFEDGEDAMEAYFTHLWETLCDSERVTLASHPFFPEIMPYILEDTDEGFCAIVTLTLWRVFGYLFRYGFGAVKVLMNNKKAKKEKAVQQNEP